MPDPKIVQKEPYAKELEPGTYAWCACGHSTKDPFCDGSHTTVGMVPKVFKLEEKKTVYLCGCKHTKNPPFCDGTHKTL